MNSPFQYLFGEISKERFIAEYFNQKPVLIKGEAGKFDRLFTLVDFNRIINNSPLEYPRARITNHINTIHKYDLIDDKDRYENNINNRLNPEKVLLAIARGGTLVLDRIHEYHEALEDFTDSLTQELNARVSVNGYYTAAHQDGVNVHFDRHDVLAIQIHGSKRWFFRHDNHVLAQPMRKQHVPTVDANATGWESVLLEAGDIFYCPRGIWHFTRTSDQSSAHLALGIYPLTLSDWLGRLEQNPNVADLLAQYVCQPFHQDGSPILPHPVHSFLEMAAVAAHAPFLVNLNRRAYIELE